MPDSATELLAAPSSKLDGQPTPNAVSEEEFDRQLDTAIVSSRQTKRLPSLKDFLRDLKDIRQGTTSIEPAEPVIR
jgi:hypothetical protein